MKDFSLLASFVAPSVRQVSTRYATLSSSNYSPALSPMRKIVGGNSAISTNGMDLALRAETMDTTSAISSMMGQEPSGVYEAVLPQTETLLGMGLITVLCVVVYWVWENQVVPVSRSKLAISKNRGEVKEYLDELKASSPPSSSAMEPSARFSSESISISSEAVPHTHSVGESSSLQQPAKAVVTVDGEENGIGNQPISPLSATKGDRAFEKWLFTDWLQDNKSGRKGGRQKEPALPILKDARWNSGDNPVVVAAFLMMVGIVFTTLTERIASLG